MHARKEIAIPPFVAMGIPSFFEANLYPSIGQKFLDGLYILVEQNTIKRNEVQVIQVAAWSVRLIFYLETRSQLKTLYSVEWKNKGCGREGS
jgi:hypothetical protein